MTDSTTDHASETVGDIVAVASGNESFSTLVAAVGAAGLVETLQGAGPFTVFAPTNEAFAALPAGLVDALLLEENRETLVKILTYHVVGSRVMAADVASGDVATVEGSMLSVVVADGVKINGSSTVTATDVMASNGVIHVIDAVLVPADVDPAPLLAQTLTPRGGGKKAPAPSSCCWLFWLEHQAPQVAVDNR
jgi:uncharacterized surface protein with fasciclin (FAS1) repeats